jgi:hypothetical protein
MDESGMKLDGNAAAGLLADVLAQDATRVRVLCAGCGAKAEVGAQTLYMFPGSPGAVLRCHACENVLIVTVRALGRIRVGIPGATWFEMPEARFTESTSSA